MVTQTPAETPNEARKPTDIVVTNLRIRKSLRHALELEARKNAVSLSREMTRRLEESLQAGTRLDLSILTEIRSDMGDVRDELLTLLLRIKGRLQAREHEEEIIRAVEAGDLATAQEHALALRRLQEGAARQRIGRLRGSTPSVEVAPAAKAG